MAVKTANRLLSAHLSTATQVSGITKFLLVKELTDLIVKGDRSSTSVAGCVTALETTVCGKSDKFAILTAVAKTRTPMIDFRSIVARRRVGMLFVGEVNGS